MFSRASRPFPYFAPLSAALLLISVTWIGVPDSVSAQQLTEVIEWADSLQLEEPDGVYTVAPEVSIDSNGGFIVTDYKESQVRLYTRSGKLKAHFGRKGKGPGELENPFAAIRLPSNQILVPEFEGTLSLFDKNGKFVKQYSRILNDLVWIQSLSDRKVLAVGEKEETPGSHPLLHQFNLESGKITRSFFPHPLPLGSYGNILFGIGQIATTDVKRNRIVAAFAPLNKLYFFNSDGPLNHNINIQLHHFRKLNEPNKNDLSTEDIHKISKEYSKISDVFWLDDEIILIQYYDLVDRTTWTLRWNLAAVTPEGEVLFDIPDTPKLFAVDPETQELFFQHPDHDFPNHWIVGRLKSSVLQAANQ